MTHVKARTAADVDVSNMVSSGMIESGHSETEHAEMLRAIGVTSVEQLFAVVSGTDSAAKTIKGTRASTKQTVRKRVRNMKEPPETMNSGDVSPITPGRQLRIQTTDVKDVRKEC